MSANAGGLLRWPVKLSLPLGFALVALQGLSEIIKCVAALTTGRRREQSRYEKTGAMIEFVSAAHGAR